MSSLLLTNDHFGHIRNLVACMLVRISNEVKLIGDRLLIQLDYFSNIEIDKIFSLQHNLLQYEGDKKMIKSILSLVNSHL